MKLAKLIFSLLLGAVTLSGCVDDPIYDPSLDGSGDGLVQLQMTFTPQEAVNLDSRSAGNAIDDIHEIFVAVYEDAPKENPEQMTLVKSFYFSADDLNIAYQQPSTDHQDAICRAIAKQRIKLPGGWHRVVVAANMGDLTGQVPTLRDFMDFQSPAKAWNSADMSANDIMAGYFTESDNEPAPATESADIIDKSRVYISNKTLSLNAWLRRAASKVTVDFDGSGLYENVFVYIQSIQIHDIPKNCPLMSPNTPESTHLLVRDGETVSVDTLAASQPVEKYYNLLPCITKAGNQYHDFYPDPHANNSPCSLFFYENAQGTGKDKRQDANADGSMDITSDFAQEGDTYWKDAKPYGAWIEVKGYYVSNNENGRGRGAITYRFMLGQNVSTDYNALRNKHYKLTLKLKGLANDVDWHIEYADVTRPGILTDVYYVSYLYNQPQISAYNPQTDKDYWEKLYPIRIIMDNGDYSSLGKTLKVRIIENNWRPDVETGDVSGFEYYTGAVYTANNSGANSVPTCNNKAIKYDGIWNGFLSLYAYPGEPTSVATGKRFSASVYADWYRRGSNPYFREANNEITLTLNSETGEKEITAIKKDPIAQNSPAQFDYGEGYREFRTDVGRYYDDVNGSYQVTEELTSTGERHRIVWIPLFTRPLIICQLKAFSGNNPYYSFQRRAKLKISVDYNGDGKDEDETATVYQVRRIINPKCVLRKYESDKEFTVSLMHRTGETHQHWFTTFNSNGRWRASLVVNPGQGWKIVGASAGNTGSMPSVKVQPSAKNQNAYALLKFEYHDYKCVHYVILRQGYDPVQIGSASNPGPYWHSFNLRNLDEETDDPLDEGSMFKYGNLHDPIDAINNRIYLTSLQIVGQTDNNGFFLSPLKTSGTRRKKWAEITSTAPGNPGDFANTNIINSGWRIPTNTDFGVLFKNNDIDFGFGICYSDGAKQCSIHDNEVHRYSWFARDPFDWEDLLGMKSDPDLIIEDDPNGEYGMRATVIYNKTNAKGIVFPMGHTGYGSRKNSNENSHQLGKLGSAVGLGQLRYGGVTEAFPAKWNNQYVPLLYTLYTQYGALYWLSDCQSWPNKEDARAWDFNYSTMDFGPYPSNEIFTDLTAANSSHAFFIRLVHDGAATRSRRKRR